MLHAATRNRDVVEKWAPDPLNGKKHLDEAYNFTLRMRLHPDWRELSAHRAVEAIERVCGQEIWTRMLPTKPGEPEVLLNAYNKTVTPDVARNAFLVAWPRTKKPDPRNRDRFCFEIATHIADEEPFRLPGSTPLDHPFQRALNLLACLDIGVEIVGREEPPYMGVRMLAEFSYRLEDRPDLGHKLRRRAEDEGWIQVYPTKGWRTAHDFEFNQGRISWPTSLHKDTNGIAVG